MATRSAPFPAASGVKRGCALAPALFAVSFSVTLPRAPAALDEQDGVCTRYRTGGSLFSPRRPKAHAETSNLPVHELLFADGAAPAARPAAALRRSPPASRRRLSFPGSSPPTRAAGWRRRPHTATGGSELQPVPQPSSLRSSISSGAAIHRQRDRRQSSRGSQSFRKTPSESPVQ